MKKSESGFTLIEMVLVLGIILMLFGFITFNLPGTQRIASVNSAKDSLFSDLSTQQTKAMQGVGSSSGTSYGIYFEQDKYILFKGTSYSELDSNNFTVPLDLGLAFINITFPGNSIIFSPGSGELSGFSNGNSSITIQDTKGTKETTITLNRYGVMASEN